MGAKNLLSHSLRIAWKDLMELFRNRMGLVLLILMPIFMMTMVGFIYPSETSLNNVPIALVNEDTGFGGTNLSSMLITTLTTINTTNDESEKMLTLINASSLEEVRTMIENGDAEGGIVISSDFTSSIMSGQQGTITLVTDQSNPQMSAMIQAVLSEVFEQMGTALAQQNVANQTGIDPSSALAVVKPYNIQTKGSVEGEFSYFDFIAPGIMAMTVMMSVMTGLPAAISQEREVGQWPRHRDSVSGLTEVVRRMSDAVVALEEVRARFEVFRIRHRHVVCGIDLYGMQDNRSWIAGAVRLTQARTNAGVELVALLGGLILDAIATDGRHYDRAALAVHARCPRGPRCTKGQVVAVALLWTLHHAVAADRAVARPKQHAQRQDHDQEALPSEP